MKKKSPIPSWYGAYSDSDAGSGQLLAEEGAENILHFSLSGGLSTTAQAAKDAAADIMEEYPSCKIYAVDSYAATIGQGALVKEAVRLRAEGKSAEEAYQAIREMPFYIQYAIIANDLF